ncbi:hypothetical protein GYMLUDRAFT_49084 [Collybiopsis luxurians FD-317 M1]|uniref:NmrA-like domain-containing protein n=1 Tax=Collybiopsis luxurians FD-317 M1 TaxID=944289 RepID=A0A0D0AU63_9AGAR|nr:hypothetical protein GYMLUDRAFT_49084 [Collybiopsis luxurians FD-317 M1]
MSLTRSVAVIGAGVIGIPIARALLSTPQRPKVIVLTRLGSTGKSLPDDLSIVPVDFNDVAGLTKVVKDHSIDVIISTVAETALEAQYAVAEAAKAAGTVKLFVPSEWGTPTEGAKAKGESNLFAEKDKFAEYLRSIELPFTRFYTGLFFGWLLWAVGADVSESVHILGKGETLFSTTSEADIAGFTAHVLTSLPLDSPHLVNQTMRLESDRITFRDVARIYKKPIVFVAEGDLIPGNTEKERQWKTALQIEVEAGGLSTGWSRAAERDEGTAGSTNKLWAGHVWDKVDKIN